jgi:uncharacterized membrane protein YvbJ
MATCPECGKKAKMLDENCPSCGAQLLYPQGPTQEAAAGETAYQSRSLLYSVVMGVLILASLVMLAIGLFSSDISAVQQSALFAAAAVFGILARISQAAKHHIQVMTRR